jgi:hypothetical protein
MRAPPDWLPPLLLVLLGAVLHLGPVWADPAGLMLGSALSEAPAHLWALGAGLEGLSQGSLAFTVPAAHPEGLTQPITSPANLLLAAPVWAMAGGGHVGRVLAWNSLHLGVVLLSGFGAWRLSRVLLPDAPARGWARAVLVGAVVFASFSWLQPWTGRAEYFTAALWPLHLALLLRFVDEGGWARGAGSGVLLALVALGGPYLGPFLLVLEGPILVGLLLTRRDRRTVVRVVGMGALALAIVLPYAAWLLLGGFPGVDSLGGAELDVARATPSAVLPAMLRLGAFSDIPSAARAGVDLAVFDGGQLPVFAYPGAVALLLGLGGALLRPRAVLPWLALLGWALVLSLGPLLAGPDSSPGHYLLPAAGLGAVVAPLRVVRTWARIGCMLGPLVGAAAALGVGAAARRWPRAGLALAVAESVLVVADLLTWPAPFARDRAVFDAAAPPGLAAGLAGVPEGAVLTLPVTGLPRDTSPRIGRAHLLWQPAHGRSISATTDERGDAEAERSLLVQLDVQSRSRGRGAVEMRRWLETPDARLRTCLRADAAALRARGFAAVVVVAALDPAPAFAPGITDALGPPQVGPAGTRVWDLTGVPAPDPAEVDAVGGSASCAPPSLSGPRPG